MMNKIASLKPGDDGVLIEALINHVVSGKNLPLQYTIFCAILQEKKLDTLTRL